MKTKLSRAILLASVALLSVVGAAVAFSTNRAINNQLMASDVEALTAKENGGDYYIISYGTCKYYPGSCDRTYGVGNGVASASATFSSPTTGYDGEFYYCERRTESHYLISYYFSPTGCIVRGLTPGWESYEKYRWLSRNFR